MELSDLLIVLRIYLAISSPRSLDILVKPLFPLLGTIATRDTSFFDALTGLSDVVAILGDGYTDIE